MAKQHSSELHDITLPLNKTLACNFQQSGDLPVIKPFRVPLTFHKHTTFYLKQVHPKK